MLKSLLKFTRLRIIVTCAALAFVGSAAVGDVSWHTVFAMLVIAIWYLHAVTANDYADRHIDAVNLKTAPDRPLVSHDISHSGLWKIHCIAGLLVLGLSTVWGTEGFILTAAMLCLNYMYSIRPFRVSDRGIFSQLLLAAAYVYYPLALGYWSSDTGGYDANFPWLLSAGLYFAFVGRLLLKDFRDVIGDKKFGKLTFVLRHGVVATCLVSEVCWLIGFVLLTLYIGYAPGLLVVFMMGLLFISQCLWRLSRLFSVRRQLDVIACIAKAANATILSLLTYVLCLSAPSISYLEVQVLPGLLGVVLLTVTWFEYVSVPKADHKPAA